jgi:Leucine-rich repeat (LRR) protein
MRSVPSTRRLSSLLLAFLVSGCSTGGSDEEPREGLSACDGEVDVPDPGLAAALRGELGIGDEAPIDADALAEILSVDASSAGVTDLEGLECARALQYAFLNDNGISDASPLAELDDLQYVYLGSNSISDVSPFAGLESLEVLGLALNQITDVSAMRGHARLHTLGINDNAIMSTAGIGDMPMLANLDLENNPISALEGLTGLPSLFSLRLGGTMVSDLGALAAVPQIDNLHVEHASLASLDSLPDLPALTAIDVSYNALTDVERLAGSGFASLDRVTLDGNPLDGVESVAAIGVAYEISINEIGVADLAPFAVESSMRRLSARGNGVTDLAPVAWVEFLDLSNNAIVDVGPLAGTAHGSTDLSDNAIVDGTPLVDVEFDSCATVSLGGNPLADGESLTEDLCAVPLVVTDVCLPVECDPCPGGGHCG